MEKNEKKIIENKSKRSLISLINIKKRWENKWITIDNKLHHTKY